MAPKREAKGKQRGSKREAKGKQMGSKREAKANKREANGKQNIGILLHSDPPARPRIRPPAHPASRV